MQFNSYGFILLFLPLFVAGYFLLNRIGGTAGKLLIAAGGIVFVLFGGWETAAVLGVSVVMNYLLSLLLSKAARRAKTLLAVSVALNVLMLFWFKYAGFAVSVLNSLFAGNLRLRDLVLPLGISFYTFQQIMFLVSVYRKEIRKVDAVDYLAYILYFPKLIMGPLTEPKDLIAQLNDPRLKKPDARNIASGVKMFCFGLFKKLVLADTFANAVAWGFNPANKATSGDLFLVMLFYTFQIFFDFSGYTDMASGVSFMLNITLPMNFDTPYKALSIRDFWKRWHMSLTGFLTRYIYIPLGGNRKGTVRTYLNIMAVFLISGFWHGANWTFILWGALHGVLQIVERLLDRRTGQRNDYAARWLITFTAVSVLWLLFRSDSVAQWLDMLKNMFSFQNMAVSEGLLSSFELPEIMFVMSFPFLSGLNGACRGLPALVFTVASMLICLIPDSCYRNREKTGAVSLILCVIAFVWAFLCLGTESVFIYNNF